MDIKKLSSLIEELADSHDAHQEIEISVIQKKFSAKTLRTICLDNGLSQGGSKIILIERIINNNLSDKLEKTSNSVKLTKNLSH